MEMKKKYVKPEAELMKFVEEEEIMNLGNEFTESILGVKPGLEGWE